MAEMGRRRDRDVGDDLPCQGGDCVQAVLSFYFSELAKQQARRFLESSHLAQVVETDEHLGVVGAQLLKRDDRAPRGWEPASTRQGTHRREVASDDGAIHRRSANKPHLRSDERVPRRNWPRSEAGVGKQSRPIVIRAKQLGVEQQRWPRARGVEGAQYRGQVAIADEYPGSAGETLRSSLAQRQVHATLWASRNISEIGIGLAGQFETMAGGGVPAGHSGAFGGAGEGTESGRLPVLQRHHITSRV